MVSVDGYMAACAVRSACVSERERERGGWLVMGCDVM